MADPLTFRGTRADVRLRLREAVAALMGRAPDPGGEAAVLLRVLGVQALALVKTDYVQKARTGVGEDGITWPPLSKRYVAYGRRHPGLDGERARAQAAGRPGRPLLTASLDKLWRGVFASTYRRLRGKGEGDEQARRTAAALAWTLVKAKGGKTILGTYGDTKVETGRDTDRLFNSLSPGDVNNRLDARPGAVVIGTNVKYAPGFHAKRPLWRENGDQWPDRWKQRLGETLGDAVAGMFRRLAQQGGQA